MVKFKGEILYEGPVAIVDFNSNWCDSMAEYYPNLSIYSIVESKIEYKLIRMEGWNQPHQPKDLEIIIDETMLAEYNKIRKEEADAVEAEIVRIRKVVRVVKGRKYPIGTEGRVFWIGTNMYGTSCGVECLNGAKFFISIGNVKVIEQEST